MIDQILETRNPAASSLLDHYMAAEARMHSLHEGAALHRAVDAILAQLPPGCVTLLATSPEGIGLAAATAMCRREATSWQPLNATIGVQNAIAGHAVVVEPIDPGPGWRSTIGRVVPGTAFAFATNARRLRVAA